MNVYGLLFAYQYRLKLPPLNELAVTGATLKDRPTACIVIALLYVRHPRARVHDVADVADAVDHLADGNAVGFITTICPNQ